MRPEVTIALSVYNGARTVADAIQSILHQDFQHWEMIILDDLSSDNSLDVIRAFDDPRILVIEGSENIGLSARLNMAVDRANGAYIARMDQDDISFPERLTLQIAYMKEYPDVDLLATATIPFNTRGVALGIFRAPLEHSQICARPWNGFHLPHPTWLGKTEWFRQHRYESTADGAEDQQLLLRTRHVSRFAALEEPLLAYREGNRVLAKMLRGRRKFARAYIHQFIAERRFGLVVRVAASFMLKCFADTLNQVFGLSRARNALHPLSASEQAAWRTLWNGVRDWSNSGPGGADDVRV